MEPNKEPAIFADGINFYRRNDNAPEWVKGKVSIHPQRFIKFMQSLTPEQLSEKGYLTMDLKESRDKATLYFQVNTFRPKKEPQNGSEHDNVMPYDVKTSVGRNGEEIIASDIPF